MRRGYVSSGCAPVFVTGCVSVVAVVVIIFSTLDPWDAMTASAAAIVVLAAIFGVMAGVRG